VRVRLPDPANTPRNRALRRLALMLLWLIALDQFVPSILARLERWHYEGHTAFRFENSDLFALGPAVAWLREHPHSNRRRVVFLGNSMTFGYELPAESALPAEFEKRQPDTRVFNMAINGHELGTSYLIAKSVVDSVDVFFVQLTGESADPMLGSLIPVDDADVARFRLLRPNRLEQLLKERLGHVWHLYADNERIQAAMFGTSTRQYLYLHKKDVLGAMLGRRSPSAPAPAAMAARPSLRVPRDVHGCCLRRVLFDFAELARAHKKRIVFIEYEYFIPIVDTGEAELNATYAPFAEIVVVHVPPALTTDGLHLNAQGARLVAEALDRHEREAAGAR
jgi:hypothetical protein